MTRSEIIDELYRMDMNNQGQIVTNYSGRGMYGKKCYGIVGTDLEEELEKVGLTEYEKDTMGLEDIYYFPWVASNEENDEE